MPLWEIEFSLEKKLGHETQRSVSEEFFFLRFPDIELDF